METIYKVIWNNESGTQSFCELKNDNGSYKGSVEAFETEDLDEARKVYTQNLESYKGCTVRELGYYDVCENSSDKAITGHLDSTVSRLTKTARLPNGKLSNRQNTTILNNYGKDISDFCLPTTSKSMCGYLRKNNNIYILTINN